MHESSEVAIFRDILYLYKFIKVHPVPDIDFRFMMTQVEPDVELLSLPAKEGKFKGKGKEQGKELGRM